MRPTATFASKTGRKPAVGSGSGAGSLETPGPGAYKTVTATTAFKTMVVPPKNQFFGSSSRRFAGSSRLNCEFTVCRLVVAVAAVAIV